MKRKPTKKSASTSKYSAVPPKEATPAKTEKPAVKIELPTPATATPTVAKTPAKAPAIESKPAAMIDINPLLSDLGSIETSTRLSAAIALGRAGNRAGTASLIFTLRDSDADVACESAAALGALGDPAAVEPLMEVLNNNEGYFHSVVRAAAAHSLAQLGDTRAVEPLINAVGDLDAEPSAEAIRALATLGDARATHSLINVVKNHTGYYTGVARRAAVLALAQLGGEQAKAALAAVATDSNEDAVIREAAGGAI
ncbi:MAG: HEAT repeat domain-containing protein [Planctomycetota bacterium]|nr:HEAT repeat domain-containing protein [Planctomycetota bacterium]